MKCEESFDSLVAEHVTYVQSICYGTVLNPVLQYKYYSKDTTIQILQFEYNSKITTVYNIKYRYYSVYIYNVNTTVQILL